MSGWSEKCGWVRCGKKGKKPKLKLNSSFAPATYFCFYPRKTPRAYFKKPPLLCHDKLPILSPPPFLSLSPFFRSIKNGYLTTTATTTMFTNWFRQKRLLFKAAASWQTANIFPTSVSPPFPQSCCFLLLSPPPPLSLFSFVRDKNQVDLSQRQSPFPATHPYFPSFLFYGKRLLLLRVFSRFFVVPVILLC